jgi:hypothetical protein
MAEFIPVDHDPFAAKQPTLVPVDHDPFAAKPAKPERGIMERAVRAPGQIGAGFNEGLAQIVGAPYDLVGAAMRGVGLPAAPPGQGADWVRSGLQSIIGKPQPPETTMENLLHGAGRGLADTGSFLVPAAMVARGAQAGSGLSQLGQALAAQPGMQMASGAIGGGVSEATGSPGAGLAAALTAPLALRGAAGLLAPSTSNLTPEANRLAAVAAQEGIRLTPGQRTGNRFLRDIESTFDSLPFTTGPQEAIHQGQREAFNVASLARSGTQSNVATPDVINAARGRIGGEIGTIANRNIMHVTPNLLSELNVIQDALKYMPSEASGPIAARLQQIEKMMVVPPSGGPNITIPGTSYRMLDSQLGRSMRSTTNGDLRSALGELRDTLRTAMDASISPADQAAWQQARRQYANLMTTAQAAGGAGTQTALGNVSPLALRQAVDQSTGRGYRYGQGDQNDLARVGQAFLRPVPDSGTAGRIFARNLLTGGGIAGMAGTGPAMAGDPLSALGAAGASVAIPRIAQALYNTGPVQRYLVEGAPQWRAALGAGPRIDSPLASALIAAQTPQINRNQ